MTFENLPDETLVEACQRGELSAFEQLLRRHHRQVYSFLFWQVGEGVVEELLRETFLRALTEAHARQQVKFTTLLYATVWDVCRRETPERTHRWVGGGKKEERILAAIGKLDDEEREVFLLREYLDVPFKQIADIIGCEQALVKERMHKALNRLRREMVPQPV